MTVVARTWNRLTLPGKLVFTLVPLLVVVTVALVAAIALFGEAVLAILGANLPIVRFVVAATAILLMTVPTAFLIIYMEMKGIAMMNLRIGPDRVGPFGEEDAVTLPALEACAAEGGEQALLGRLMPLESAPSALLALTVSPSDAASLVRGQPVLIRGRDAPVLSGLAYAVSKGRLIALGEIDKGALRPTRVFNLS